MRSSVTSKRFQANEQLYYPDVFTVDIKHNIIPCTCELLEKVMCGFKQLIMDLSHNIYWSLG